MADCAALIENKTLTIARLVVLGSLVFFNCLEKSKKITTFFVPTSAGSNVLGLLTVKFPEIMVTIDEY
jgi:hypothetical protein